MKHKLISILLLCALLLSGCNGGKNTGGNAGTTGSLGGDDKAFGEALDDLGVYEGYFEDVSETLSVTCVSGTEGCYTIDGGTVTFTQISEDSVYAISGQLKGNIVIDVGDAYKFDLEMRGFSVISESINPVTVLSGDEISLTAKKGFENYIYDDRSAIDETDESLYSGAVHSVSDLEICGKGSLTVVSEFNNGIHSKDDLQVKNLSLKVVCADNALKGNDSVSLENAQTILISTVGDGIKTTNSDISESGKQRGTITITGGTHNIYAACDGIDASYDVVIQDASTVLNIYTDKYSNYSNEVTTVDEENYYIRFTSDSYSYSVKYYNTDDDYLWVNPEYHSQVSGGRSIYYYYAYPIQEGYSKIRIFIYSSDQPQGQEDDYLACTDYLTVNQGYDTFALTTRGNQLSFEWTNYTTTVVENNFGPGGGGRPGGMGGFGGMGEGNTDKGTYSTKGMKAGNEIVIYDGEISIKSYDDAMHSNADELLENGQTPLGNITIHGGAVTVYSNDDGLHADGKLIIHGGSVAVTNSYEGMEGMSVEINGGEVSVLASDDGINATTTSGTAVTINSGTIYIYCSGDGIDSNSRTSGTGIVFNGGNTVVISSSGGNSAIDTENGYTYYGGSVLAIMPSGGMTSEATHCSNFSSIATRKSVSAASESYVTVKVGSASVVTAKMPIEMNATAIYLGSASASIDVVKNSPSNVDSNGVCWENAE